MSKAVKRLIVAALPFYVGAGIVWFIVRGGKQFFSFEGVYVFAEFPHVNPLASWDYLWCFLLVIAVAFTLAAWRMHYEDKQDQSRWPDAG